MPASIKGQSARRAPKRKRAAAHPTAAPSVASPPERVVAATPYTAVAPRAELPLMAAARSLRSWAETVLGVAGSAVDMSLTLAKARARGPRGKAAIANAGAMLKQWRETAGLTAQEVGRAIDLRDTSLLEDAESGKAALPFEIILRLAGVLGRHDPIPFVMKLTRSYNPDLWKALEELGVGRLVVQGSREREFANIYRASEAARRLSDHDFATVLGFTRTAFDMAVDFKHPRKKETSP